MTKAELTILFIKEIQEELKQNEDFLTVKSINFYDDFENYYYCVTGKEISYEWLETGILKVWMNDLFVGDEDDRYDISILNLPYLKLIEIGVECEESYYNENKSHKPMYSIKAIKDLILDFNTTQFREQNLNVFWCCEDKEWGCK